MPRSPLRKALLLQGDDDWVKLNVEQYGFYRVQYPDELWQRLTEVAARVVDDIPLLPEVEFAGLLGDAWALNDAGIVPVHTFLNLTRYDVAPFPHSLFLRASWPSCAGSDTIMGNIASEFCPKSPAVAVGLWLPGRLESTCHGR